jgi:hypothetical protein
VRITLQPLACSLSLARCIWPARAHRSGGADKPRPIALPSASFSFFTPEVCGIAFAVIPVAECHPNRGAVLQMPSLDDCRHMLQRVIADGLLDVQVGYRGLPLAAGP